MEALKSTFKPEFLNRLDEIIVFNKLTDADIEKITDIMLKEVTARIAALGINAERTNKSHNTRSVTEKAAIYFVILNTSCFIPIASPISSNSAYRQKSHHQAYKKPPHANAKSGIIINPCSERAILYCSVPFRL